MVNADSPEAMGGEWSAGGFQYQQSQQQQSQQQHQQQQQMNLAHHRYPYTSAAAHAQFHESEPNLLDGISWDDLNALLPKK
ncbi:hypothetical protein SCUCBS95973_003733 [Sporothrix curviconia]|uniref:Uncharacterized protein n=1 Tax=Sporothrix curviconia TaxID=1260050 RepID=A0ABP0BHU3_9PEZI